MVKDIFKENKELDVVYKTSDGVPFYTPHNANNHALKLKDKKVDKITRSEALKSEKKGNKLSAEERINIINELENIEDVNVALKGEKALTVLAAGEEKLTELNILAIEGRISVINSLETVEAVNRALEKEESEDVLAAGKIKLEQLNLA